MPPAVKIALGVLGGWLAIMAPAVVTLALRLQEFDASGLPSTYALILGLGWLTMMAALIVSGYLADAVRSRTGSRTPLARVAVPLIVIGGLLLALAPSPHWLLLAWICAQIPSAMVITTALAEAGDDVPISRRGLSSGLAGAASLAALLIGTLAVRFLADNLTWAFIFPAIAGALFALPLLWRSASTESGSGADSPGAGLALPGVMALWAGFLIASFLLSWSTSTTNGFLVTFVQYGLATPVDQVADLTTLLVIVAAALAVVASILGGLWSAGAARALRLWILAAAICALAVGLLLLHPTPGMLIVSALLFGAAFGIANGVELAVVLSIRTDAAKLGRDLGIYTAVTSAPYVLVPALATQLLSGDSQVGVVQLFALACASALIGAIVILVIAAQRRSRQLLGR